MTCLLFRSDKLRSILCGNCLRTICTSIAASAKTPKNIKGKNVTAQNWIRRQLTDPYVKKAKLENYRCRSAFKLLELDDKFKLIKQGAVVIDCGAAPGSWSQVAVNRLNSKGGSDYEPGMVIGVDLQFMSPVLGAIILEQSDLTADATQSKIREILDGRTVDLVISDMAPNCTGMKELDHDLIVKLAAKALHFSLSVLRTDGHFVTKLWDGKQLNKFKDVAARYFKQVHLSKPNASRMDSAEVFIVAKHFQGVK